MKQTNPCTYLYFQANKIRVLVTEKIDSGQEFSYIFPKEKIFTWWSWIQSGLYIRAGLTSFQAKQRGALWKDKRWQKRGYLEGQMSFTIPQIHDGFFKEIKGSCPNSSIGLVTSHLARQFLFSIQSVFHYALIFSFRNHLKHRPLPKLVAILCGPEFEKSRLLPIIANN